MRSVLSVLLLVVVGSGCSDSMSGGNVAGNWQQAETVPGNSLSVNLIQRGAEVSGDGTWCGEALRCGTLTVSGTASATIVHLDITLDSGLIEHFEGRLRTFQSLEGSIRLESPGQPPTLPFAAKFQLVQF